MDTTPLELDPFQQRFNPLELDFYKPLYARHAGTIKVKRESTALPNLQKIFLQTLKISNASGFQSMGLRDLSAATGISLGALYSYIDSKEQLLRMVIGHVLDCIHHGLGSPDSWPTEPRARLAHLLRAHLYLSEALQPWFFFAYMEARHVGPDGRQFARQAELLTEDMIHDCLEQARLAGALKWGDCTIAASLIKPLLQEWYLKRWKYRQRAMPVEHYADATIAFIEQALFVD